MNTYNYTLVTDAYEAAGQVDAEDEAAAEELLRYQVAHPRSARGIQMDTPPEPPVIKSIELELRTSA